MSHQKFAAIAFTSKGYQALRYIEPDGNDMIIHNVITIDGVAIDMKLQGFEKLPDDKFEELHRTLIEGFDTAAADRMFSQITAQLGFDQEGSRTSDSAESTGEPQS